MTSSSATAPAEPTHPCVRCGAQVAPGVGLCERCNPLGLRDVAASQAHGTIFIGVAIGVVGLALLARMAVTGIGPFPAAIGPVVPTARGLDVTLTVTNQGSSAGQTTCRVVDSANRGGGPSALLLSPVIEPGGTRTFSQVVTEFGSVVSDLVVECRLP